MGIFMLVITAVGLSMDAFAVSVCNGISLKSGGLKSASIVGLYFGVFQAVMPLLGFFLAAQFASHIQAMDHWVAFALLAIIGGKMIWESFSKKEKPCEEVSLRPRKMIPMAFATSVDAMAVGISFAFLQIDIVLAVSLIGVITCVLSMVGVKLGSLFGARFTKKAELMGGVVLVLIGTKILVEHLFSI